MVCVWWCTKTHKLLSSSGYLCIKPDSARWASMTSQPVSWWMWMLSVCFHSSNQISGFNTSKHVSKKWMDGHLQHRLLCSNAVLLRMVENRAESWVYLKWHKDGCLFLEHWIISALTLSLSLSLSDYLSESQSDAAQCPHIPQGSSRGQRVKNKIRAERIGRGRVELIEKNRRKERWNQALYFKEYLQRFRTFLWNHSNKKILQK